MTYCTKLSAPCGELHRMNPTLWHTTVTYCAKHCSEVHHICHMVWGYYCRRMPTVLTTPWIVVTAEHSQYFSTLPVINAYISTTMVVLYKQYCSMVHIRKYGNFFWLVLYIKTRHKEPQGWTFMSMVFFWTKNHKRPSGTSYELNNMPIFVCC